MSQKDWATEWDSASCFFTENKFKQGQEKVKVTKIKWEQNQNGALTLTKIIERRSLRFFTAVFDYFSLFNFCEFLFEEGSVNKQVFVYGERTIVSSFVSMWCCMALVFPRSNRLLVNNRAKDDNKAINLDYKGFSLICLILKSYSGCSTILKSEMFSNRCDLINYLMTGESRRALNLISLLKKSKDISVAWQKSIPRMNSSFSNR